jgi:hypothetical protein
MPTAIVRFQTHEGFVIVADGRAVTRKGKVERTINDAQKIFPIPGTNLVYALYGTMEFGVGEITLDLVSEVKASVDSLADQEFEDATLYAEQISLPVFNRLLEAKTSGEIRVFPARAVDIEKDRPGHTIGHVFMFGYYNGQPVQIDIRFFHRSQVLDMKVFPNELWIGYDPEIWGSDIVAEALFNSPNDVFFESERRKLPRKTNDLGIAEALAVAQIYISACDSETGRAVDPHKCASIGGDVHAVAITPAEGFRWLIPPKSLLA